MSECPIDIHLRTLGGFNRTSASRITSATTSTSRIASTTAATSGITYAPTWFISDWTSRAISTAVSGNTWTS